MKAKFRTWGVVKKWSRKFGLQEWKFAVVWLDDNGMEKFLKRKGRFIGGCTIGDKMAIIALGHNHVKTKEDMENTIVHELLHVLLSEFDPGRKNLPKAERFEQIILTLEEAICRSTNQKKTQ